MLCKEDTGLGGLIWFEPAKWFWGGVCKDNNHFLCLHVGSIVHSFFDWFLLLPIFACFYWHLGSMIVFQWGEGQFPIPGTTTTGLGTLISVGGPRMDPQTACPHLCIFHFFMTDMNGGHLVWLWKRFHPNAHPWSNDYHQVGWGGSQNFSTPLHLHFCALSLQLGFVGLCFLIYMLMNSERTQTWTNYKYTGTILQGTHRA